MRVAEDFNISDDLSRGEKYFLFLAVNVYPSEVTSSLMRFERRIKKKTTK